MAVLPQGVAGSQLRCRDRNVHPRRGDEASMTTSRAPTPRSGNSEPHGTHRGRTATARADRAFPTPVIADFPHHSRPLRRL